MGFGEWPHMCAVLAEEPVAQDPGYAGEPQTVNLYQCGSPLVCQSKFDPTSYVQAGIVAWGIGCGEDNTPGVYASVSKGVCWIDYAMTCQFGQQSGSYSSYW